MTTMTPDEIDALPAGRELDALVAEKVMGEPPTYQVVIDGTSRSRQYPMRNAAEKAKVILGERFATGQIEVGDDVPDYSTDIAAAWEVVEKFDTWEIVRRYDPERPMLPRPFVVWASVTRFNPEAFNHANAEIASLAICRAALKAVMP